MNAIRLAPTAPAKILATATLMALVLTAPGVAGVSTPRGRASGEGASSGARAGRAVLSAPPHGTIDSSMTLRGGEEGTVFRTLTVEGENRIHFEVQRPDLRLDLDPEKAPGLDWGSARDVLDRTTPDLVAPLLAASARDRSPYVAHPWLSHFASGVVARFRPNVQGVERWKLSVATARGEAVTSFQGRGDPPREIVWNGLSAAGVPVLPGLTYSYVFEAHDRAGNRRNFVGDGFGVTAWRLETPSGPALAFSGSELRAGSAGGFAPVAAADAAPPVVIEAATWLNQSTRLAQPLRVEASARSAEEANLLASNVARWIGPLLIGGAARVQVATEVRPDAPELGAVRISAAR